MPLRYYQEEAKQSALFALEEFDSILLSLPTGSGKTVVAAHLIKEFLPSRCLFLADQNELTRQPLTVIDREAGIIPALDKAKAKAAINSKVVVASSQTLAKRARMERFPPKWFDYAIVDEAHRGSERDKKITDYLARKVIGITATPFTATLRDLSKYYAEVAYTLPMINLIAEGFAPEIKWIIPPVEIDLANVEVTRGIEGKEYDAESFATTIEPYYEKIVEIIKREAEGRHVMVFLPLIRSSEAFAAIARRAGVQAIHIDGKSEDRDDIVEAFRRGRYQWLCNSKVLGTGVDIPIADCFVDLSGSHSKTEYQQRFGRGMRVLPGVIDDIPEKHQAEERRARIAASAKRDCLVLDFMWIHDKLGVAHAGQLFAQNEEDAQAIFEKVKKQRTPEDLLRIAKQVQEEREALVVKRLEEVATRATGHTIEPKAFGYLIGSSALMNYEPVAQWECEKPSERQLEKLGQWGIDVSQVESKGFASKLIDAMVTRFKFRLASTSQLRALSKIGVQFNPRRLTSKEAGRMISEAKLATLREPSA